MTSPTVRELVADDVDAVRDFFASLPASDRTFFYQNVEDPAVIAAWAGDERRVRRCAVGDDGTLLALAALQPGQDWTSHVAELVLLVAPAARRRHLGRTMARAMLIEAVQHGFLKVTVMIAAESSGAVDRHQEPQEQNRDGELVTFTAASVYVREVGSGEPLLLINGLGAHTGMWRVLEQNLPGVRIVEFDLSGAGQSPMPAKPVTIRHLAELSVEVMDHFGLDRADVLGYSMGGMVAQELAAGHPGRVRRVVMAATTPGVGAIQVDLRAMLNVMTPVRYLSPRIYARTIGSMVGGRARHDAEWVAEQAQERLVHRPTWRGYMRQMRSMAGWSGLPVLRDISRPTLVIAGGDDPLAPPTNAKMIAHLIPGSRLLVLEGEGHLLMVDERSAARAAVREFLSATDIASAHVWRQAVAVNAGDVTDALAEAPRQRSLLSLLGSRARRRWLGLARTERVA